MSYMLDKWISREVFDVVERDGIEYFLTVQIAFTQQTDRIILNLN